MKGLIFTYLLTGGGTIASLFRPYYGLLIYVAFAIIKPDYLWHWSVPEGNYSRIIAIGLLIGWACAGFGDWRAGRGKATIVLLVLFWALVMLGSIIAPNKDLAWSRIEGLSKVYLPFLVGVTLIDSVPKLRQLAWVILLSEGYLAFEFNLTYLSAGFVPDDFMFGGLDNNSIAITMVTATGLAFFLGLHAERLWMKTVAFGFAACMIHVVLFSMSRGGVLALMITGVVSFVLIPKRPQHYFYFLMAVAGTIYLMGPEVRERFATAFVSSGERDSSSALRVRHWEACWQSMQAQPFGIGTANWPMFSPNYGLPSMAGHSTWLQIGAELGFPGILCLLSFYLVTAGRLWPLARGRTAMSDPGLQQLARMVIASLVGFVVSAQFVSLEGVELPYYVTLVGVGVLKLQSLGVHEPESEPEQYAAAESPVFATTEVWS